MPEVLSQAVRTLQVRPHLAPLTFEYCVYLYQNIAITVHFTEMAVLEILACSKLLCYLLGYFGA